IGELAEAARRAIPPRRVDSRGAWAASAASPRRARRWALVQGNRGKESNHTDMTPDHGPEMFMPQGRGRQVPGSREVFRPRRQPASTRAKVYATIYEG